MLSPTSVPTPAAGNRVPGSRIPLALTALFLGLFAAVAMIGFAIGRGVIATEPAAERHESAAPPIEGAELVRGKADTIRLPKSSQKALGLRLDMVENASDTSRLVLSGTLFIDSNRLAYVHSRFPGEVIEMGQVPKRTPGSTSDQSKRNVRIGDTVEENQILAVLWSKDMGEKKSDLVDALSKIDASRSTLQRLQSLERGAVSEQQVREARRQYEADLIAVERAERTLRSWKETDEEIAEVYREAERIRTEKGKKDPSNTAAKALATWANVEVRAPFRGTVLEKNVSVGEIVDSDQVLFKIADLSRIGVLANVYEEDLPKLAALTPEQRKWQILLKAEPESPPITGQFEVVGNIIDPGQHTAAVLGWIANPNNRLRVGQFITATVELTAGTPVIAVPNAAVIDEGDEAFVFVAGKDDPSEFTKVNVHIVRRGRDLTLLARETESTGRKSRSLAVGDRVVINGNLELLGVLQNATDSPEEAGTAK